MALAPWSARHSAELLVTMLSAHCVVWISSGCEKCVYVRFVRGVFLAAAMRPVFLINIMLTLRAWKKACA